MRHYKSLVEFHFDKAQPMESQDLAASLVVGFYITLGVLSCNLQAASSFSFEHTQKLATAPGRIVSVEIKEVDQEGLSTHVKEAGRSALREGVYYSTGQVYFRPEIPSPWWKFW